MTIKVFVRTTRERDPVPPYKVHVDGMDVEVKEGWNGGKPATALTFPVHSFPDTSLGLVDFLCTVDLLLKTEGLNDSSFVLVEFHTHVFNPFDNATIDAVLARYLEDPLPLVDSKGKVVVYKTWWGGVSN